MTAKHLLLVLILLALLTASGVVYAQATQTTFTWLQILLGITDEGTTWTEGGITHVRGQAADTMCQYDYNGDGTVDQVTMVELTTVNSDRNADGVGPFWGTWSEYDYATGAVLVDRGIFRGQYTCTEGLGGPEYTYGWVDILAWRLGPDGDRGQFRGTAICYSEPDVPPFIFLGEARFLVPGGQ